jgi:hypothetical protein
MNSLICERLGLAIENWPPDHYALLGLERGQGDSRTIEDRVHERMQRVRPLQIAYPEEATEAMNRLAQALSCLTDPALRDRYDESLKDLTFRRPATSSSNSEGPLDWLFGPWDRLIEGESPFPSSAGDSLRDWTPSMKPPRRRKTNPTNADGERTSHGEEGNALRTAEPSFKEAAWFWRISQSMLLLLSLLALVIAVWRQLGR